MLPHHLGRRLLLALLLPLFLATPARAAAVYRVLTDFSGGYHLQFEMVFADDVGRKTQGDLIAPAHTDALARFWGDAESEFPGPWQRPSTAGLAALDFDPATLALRYRDTSWEVGGWTWFNLPDDPDIGPFVSVQTCTIGDSALSLCGVRGDGGQHADVPFEQLLDTVRLSVQRVPEPPLPGLVLLGLLALGVSRRPQRGQRGPQPGAVAGRA